MKAISLLPLLLLGLGCVAPQALQDDFTPVRGAASAPADQAKQDGPHDKTVRAAVSSDGLLFTPTNVWICEQCRIQSAIVQNGTIYLYYNGWIVGDRVNTSAVAISRDQGKTWNYNYLELEDGGHISYALDPYVVPLEDGTLRLFFTGDNPRSVHFADSRDGLHFRYGEPIFGQRDDVATRPIALDIADTWHLYANSKDGFHRLWHLTSTQPEGFTVSDLTSFPNQGRVSAPGSGLWIEDWFYLYLADGNGTIGSMKTKNGLDWYPSDQTHLAPGEGQAALLDPSVVKLEDGRYVMFYSTKIPSP